MAPSNEALIKLGNKSSFVVPFRIIIHLFAWDLAVILNAMSLLYGAILGSKLHVLTFCNMNI